MAFPRPADPDQLWAYLHQLFQGHTPPERTDLTRRLLYPFIRDIIEETRNIIIHPDETNYRLGLEAVQRGAPTRAEVYAIAKLIMRGSGRGIVTPNDADMELLFSINATGLGGGTTGGDLSLIHI